jgi:hypothetical protein
MDFFFIGNLPFLKVSKLISMDTHNSKCVCQNLLVYFMLHIHVQSCDDEASNFIARLTAGGIQTLWQ